VFPPLLLTIPAGVSEEQLRAVVWLLPACVSATADFEVETLVVRWADDCDAGAINMANAVLSESGLFRAGPGSEEAVRRYLPPSTRRSSWAAWENGHGGWDIFCERCRWTSRHESEDSADLDRARHDREVHADK
jgi:hypothetical protein